VDDPSPPDADAPEWLYLADLTREAVSPLARAERVLHPWSSWVILPLFALANAGISLAPGDLTEAIREPVAAGLVLARVLGKPAGILLAAFVAVRIGVARLPSETTWAQLASAGAAAGIPFAVSLYIARAALPAGLVEPATAGILLGALLAGVVGLVGLRLSRPGGTTPRQR